jgi:sulfate transport system ATP-binding protein
VTHDQEEAMEVADEIVVINEGRVEQIGSPDQLYDEPANHFVMGFLGETTRLGGVVLRPHDIAVSRTPETAAAAEGVVSRVLRVGFEVRLTVLTDDGEEVLVIMTRTQSRQLGLEEGVRVWVTPAAGATTVAETAATA